MDRVKRCAATILICTALSGCYTMRAEYTPPIDRVEQQTIVNIARPPSQVIQSILRAAPVANFQITVVDRDTGRIDIHFSGDPEKYVDCGTLDVVASNIEGHNAYAFPMAKERQQFRGWANGGIRPMEQISRLDARATILLSPEGRGATRAAVTTTYEFRRRIQEPGIVGFSHELRVSFRGAEIGRATGERERLTCVSNGKFPEEILRMIN